MRIRIVSRDSKNFHLFFPTAFIFSRTTASLAGHIVKGQVEKHGEKLPFSDEALEAFICGLGRWRRTHGPLKLVDVASANGDIIEIII